MYATQIALLSPERQAQIILDILKEKYPKARGKVSIEYNSDGPVEYSAWVSHRSDTFPCSPSFILVCAAGDLIGLRRAVESC